MIAENNYKKRLHMKLETIVVLSLFVAYGLIEFFLTNFFHKKGQTKHDSKVELIGGVLVIVFIQPAIIFSGAFVAKLLIPNLAGSLSGIHFVAGFALFLLFDDMVNYWWHRTIHKSPTFYNLHRAHHNGEYMSVRVVFRNNVFYYVFAPYYWFSGVLIFLGLGWVFVWYVIIKMLITISCHSDVRWDKPLYEIKWLSPIMWVVERAIVTPSFHHAHHGKYLDDGVTNYKGNYGNMLFFWDIIFGTAKITRQYPPEFGVENLPETSVAEQLLWPVIRTKQPTMDPAE